VPVQPTADLWLLLCSRHKIKCHICQELAILINGLCRKERAAKSTYLPIAILQGRQQIGCFRAQVQAKADHRRLLCLLAPARLRPVPENLRQGRRFFFGAALQTSTSKMSTSKMSTSKMLPSKMSNSKMQTSKMSTFKMSTSKMST
jgi:hypothetical protein